MREPVQVLIIPYIFVDSDVQVLILKRRKGAYWQFISGGMEYGETLEDTAKRETYEEIGTKISDLFSLQTRTMIPANVFNYNFRTDPIFVFEYTFAFHLKDIQNVILSEEHSNYQIVTYKEAMKCLKWDSNKTALYELFKTMRWNVSNKIDKDIFML
ncbi:NUDIX pyrophosphatase [Bacteroidia bacterium]|nr:NUDIX pyrophosphatase [Bacteroidia bacterium]